MGSLRSMALNQLRGIGTFILGLLVVLWRRYWRFSSAHFGRISPTSQRGSIMSGSSAVLTAMPPSTDEEKGEQGEEEERTRRCKGGK